MADNDTTKKVRRVVIRDAQRQFVKGIILEEGQTLQDAGESIPEGCTLEEVEEFPSPPPLDERLQRIANMRTASREDFAELVLEEARKMVMGILDQEILPQARRGNST